MKSTPEEVKNLKPIRIVHELIKGDVISGFTLHFKKDNTKGVNDIFFRLGKNTDSTENFVSLDQDVNLEIWLIPISEGERLKALKQRCKQGRETQRIDAGLKE